MSTKSKGINAERELIHKFWGNGFAAIRAPASGAMRYPSPDIIAGNNERTLAIESKVCSENSKYLTKEEVQQLKEFSKTFGAEPWIAVKFSKLEWFFINIEDLKETNKNFTISREKAKQAGLLFEELIESK